jgi:hypothetical protein
MARPRRKSARETKENYTLVRGATGALYLISETGKTRELKDKEKKEAIKILDDCEDKLSESIGPLGIKRVCVGVPILFVKHR